MKIIKLPLYKTQVGYFYQPDLKKARRKIKTWTGQEYDNEASDGLCFTKEGHAPFIWFKKKDPGLIAHEVIHAAWFVLEDAGIEIGPKNHEALTYLVGFLIRNIKL